MGPVVLKFGGTSVQDEQALRRLVSIVAATRGARVIVVSALSGVTNTLVDVAQRPSGPERADALGPVVDRHLKLVSTLTTGALQHAAIEHISAMFHAAASSLRRAGVLDAVQRDALLAIGELASSRLVAAVLACAGIDARWVDARRALVTDDRHGAARPLRDETRDAVSREIRPHLEAGHVAVLGGFVGATCDRRPTTLGRGGSDYSAAIVAAAVDASRVEIWTDVDGLLSADPRVVPDANLLERISGVEAYDLARFGARVLHAGTLEPVAEPRIPVHIRNSRRPSVGGTEIGCALDPDAPAVAGLAHRHAVSVIDFVARDLGASADFLDRVAECVDHGAHHAVTPVAVSPQRAVIAVDDVRSVEGVCQRLRAVADVASVQHGGLVAVVGHAVHSDPAVWRALVHLRERAVVNRVVQSSSGCALVAITALEAVNDVVRELHGISLRRQAEVA